MIIALALSCVTCDVCDCITVVLSVVCSLLSLFSFSGPAKDYVDRYDYLNYGSDCDEWDDEDC